MMLAVYLGLMIQQDRECLLYEAMLIAVRVKLTTIRITVEEDQNLRSRVDRRSLRDVGASTTALAERESCKSHLLHPLSID